MEVLISLPKDEQLSFWATAMAPSQVVRPGRRSAFQDFAHVRCLMERDFKDILLLLRAVAADLTITRIAAAAFRRMLSFQNGCFRNACKMLTG